MAFGASETIRSDDFADDGCILLLRIPKLVLSVDVCGIERTPVFEVLLLWRRLQRTRGGAPYEFGVWCAVMFAASIEKEYLSETQ